MNEVPRALKGTPGRTGGDRSRGQSDTIAIVLLLGMVFVSAGVVVITGGILLDDVQGDSEHELAVDSAVQTHQQIAEALQSGEARQLAVSDAVDMRVRDSGHLQIEMYNSAGDACSGTLTSEVNPIETDLGAIVYETPQGEVIYEGGAIWERTEGGISTRRAPPISYDGDSARISVQTVTTDADAFDGQMARPNEAMETAMATNTSRMLTECPSHSYRTINISVTSPYHQQWEQHFDENVDTGENVSVDSAGDTVWVEIENATSPHESRGLRFETIDGPPNSTVGPRSSPYPNNFNLTAAVVNDGFESRNGSVELEINGESETLGGTERVSPVGSENFTFSSGVGPSWTALNRSPYDLKPNTVYEYTLRLWNEDENEIVSNTTGKFYFAESGGGDVSFFDDDYSLRDGADTLLVNATLINTLPTNATNETVEFQITDEDVNMSDPMRADLHVRKFGGTTQAAYELNVSKLQAGAYEYELRHDNVTRELTFAIPPTARDGGAIVGDLRVESIDPSARYVTNGSSFNVSVQLHNVAPTETTGDVSLDVLSEASLYNDTSVTIDDGDRETVTLTLSAEELADLETRTAYDYNVTVEDDGEQRAFPGKFVFMEPGKSLQIDENTTTKSDGIRWVNVTLANHGVDPGADNVSFELYDDDTGDLVGDTETDAVHLDSTNETTVPFNLTASALGGAYRYEVSYGEDTVEGYFTEGEAETGDGNVSITAPGNGTVSVLGTEVSAFSPERCYPILGCTPAQKSWAPTTVSTILDIDGEETDRTFNNTAADESSYHNETNFNTYDTQDAIYTRNWNQTSGESATLTLSSSYWAVEDDTVVNTRDGVEDVQPGHDVLTDSPVRTVNANSETNKHAVKVLKDGDEIPNPQTSGEDQRSAAEILNQGAADRIDDGTLDLGPYEAVFLFELTTSSYDGMWNDSFDEARDPDFNDVIALVSFNPDDPDEVELIAGNHSVSFGPAPDNPQSANDTGEQDIGINGTTQSSGTGGDPSTPTPENPDPGAPSQPDEIDVDVGGVVVG